MAKIEPRGASSRKVSLKVRAPGARQVAVTGEFSGWTPDGVRMNPAGGDQWEATLVLPPGKYQYRLRIDGQWGNNPDAGARVPNPFGGQNDLLVIG